MIALLATGPEPVYRVVLPPDEKSVVLSQTNLEPTGLNAGRALILYKSD